ncbi:hypothetical protein [Geotalea uraniireducens]|uniref:Uncharacterized protein n=1 Tax=Geotalea uraniireducens (strain Rf4) TaxID=351605 RepID=A5G6A9_GEOUR|nr:hypothetical protein [Geotalea uraniireducens]ABQ27327.1 hypothetical protein Gura_3166 [Geotalea uraniireducens Rf4]
MLKNLSRHHEIHLVTRVEERALSFVDSLRIKIRNELMEMLSETNSGNELETGDGTLATGPLPHANF